MSKIEDITQCPMQVSINILSGKWKLHIIWRLSNQGRGFNELKKSIKGITNKSLSQQLQELEEAGIVERNVYTEKPLRTEYKLTERGETLRPLLGTLCEWGTSYLEVEKEAEIKQKSS